MVTITSLGKLQGILDGKSLCIMINIIIINEQKLSQEDYFNQFSLKALF